MEQNTTKTPLPPAWARAFGMLFFTGMMATGYYYNLTFVQFGLLDLGVRLVGLTDNQVAVHMAGMAALTSIIAVAVGWWMARRGLSSRFVFKLRLALGVVVAQTILTALAPTIRSPAGFSTWIVLASVALGFGVPATFSLTVDLVPVRMRGLLGALITAGAYLPAVLISPDWTVEVFSRLILAVMLAGGLALAWLALYPSGLVRQLAAQHSMAEFANGRFLQRKEDGSVRIRRSLVVLLLLMFGIFFVDSLGFLRLADTPFFFETAWQSPELGPRLTIGIAHLLAALVGGVLYTALGEKELFLWIFGIFSLVHLMSSMTARSAVGDAPPLAMPILYAVAVSLYTVVNFALWADISTPSTISRNTAVGVAFSGWTATFVSTALALQMQAAGVALETHLRIVDALAMLFFLLVLLMIFFAPNKPKKEVSV